MGVVMPLQKDNKKQKTVVKDDSTDIALFVRTSE
jgi:hypothetical protein